MLSFIGRGSAFNTKEGNTSAFYKVGNDMLLIDCGSDVYARLREKNILDDVENIWIALTHLHPDHVGSLGDLIFYMFYIKGTRPKILTPQNVVYDPFAAKFISDIMTMLNIQGITPNFYEIVTSEIPELGTIIGFSPVNHIAQYLSYSLNIVIEETVIFYSGDGVDICPSPELYDIIYQEFSFYETPVHCHYTKLKEYGKYKDKVYLMHIDDSSKLWSIPNMGFKVVELV